MGISRALRPLLLVLPVPLAACTSDQPQTLRGIVKQGDEDLWLVRCAGRSGCNAGEACQLVLDGSAGRDLKALGGPGERALMVVGRLERQDAPYGYADDFTCRIVATAITMPPGNIGGES